MNLCRQLKNGSWSLSGDYLDYRKDGGKWDPETWNHRIKELRKETKSIRKVGDKEES